VCVRKDKKAVLDCLESEILTQMITTDPRLASVHVLPMNRLTIEVHTTVYCAEYCGTYIYVLYKRHYSSAHMQV